MLAARVSGEPNPDSIADLAPCSLRKKDSRDPVGAHRRGINRAPSVSLTAGAASCRLPSPADVRTDAHIDEGLRPYHEQFELLQTMLGIRHDAAASILAE